MELGFTILPGYIAPLTMNNSVIQSLDVDLLYLDLHVSYRKESNSVAVKKILEILKRIYLNINRDQQS